MLIASNVIRLVCTWRQFIVPLILKNDVEKKPDTNFVTGKYINHFIILNVYINQKKLELHSHKQAFLR
jgi:hypothetical protein